MTTHSDRRRALKKIATRTTLYLVAVMALLAAIALALWLKLGEAFWPAWVIAHRTQLLGLDLFALLAVLCASPIIVEANTTPRHLSGPGHNPEQGAPR